MMARKDWRRIRPDDFSDDVAMAVATDAAKDRGLCVEGKRPVGYLRCIPRVAVLTRLARHLPHCHRSRPGTQYPLPPLFAVADVEFIMDWFGIRSVGRCPSYCKPMKAERLVEFSKNPEIRTCVG
jgi:hypothetical protein